MILIRIIFIFIYTAVNVILFFLNWDLFTTVVPMNMIFGEAFVMPFLVIQLFGLLILLSLWAIEHFKDVKQNLQVTRLEKELLELEKDSEIASLKKKISKEETIERQKQV